MSPRPRVVLVTEHWGESESEPTTITRLLAGALARSAEVEVLHLGTDERAPSTRRDSVFTVHTLPRRGGRPFRAQLMRAALASSSRHLSATLERAVEDEAGTTEGVGEAITALAADAIVLCGYEQRFDRSVLHDVEAPIVFVPILDDLARADGAVVRGVVAAARRIATVGPAEDAALRRAFPARDGDIVPLAVALPLNRSATSQKLFGVRFFGTYVLLLRAFPPDSHRYERLVTRELLTSLLGVSVAEIDGERFTLSDQENTVELPVNPTRVNLWRLMAHAEITIDARPPGPFGQETIESLLLGTPVVVPAGSAAHAVATASGGGLGYIEPGDLIDAARALLEPGASARAGTAGQAWAEANHADAARFVARAAEVVFGTAQEVSASNPATMPSRMSDSE